jgi:hypothetical protein
LLAVAIAAVVAVVVLDIVLFVRAHRRRSRTRLDVEAHARKLRRQVPPDTTDVNIFAVDLTDHELRVGYSYLDAGIPIRWRILTKNAKPLHGEFVSEGGSTPHYVRLPISAQIAHDAPAQISFDWTLGDTPFAYSVTRTPG